MNKLLLNPNFPFKPKKFPFFYGWMIALLATIGMISSIPGQTMGVGVFTEYLIKKTGLNRLEISLAYMTGTIISSLIVPFAGRVLDKLGARTMVIIAGLGLSLALLLLAGFGEWNQSMLGFIPWFSVTVKATVIMIFIFLLLRQFGQGIMTMTSRNMLSKWFETRRGLVGGISGVAVSFGFSIAPQVMNDLIRHFDYIQTILIMALTCGLGTAILGWLFFRDNPEECGLLMDNGSITGRKVNPEQSTRAVTLVEARKTYDFWIFCLGMCSSSFIITGFTFHISSIGKIAGLSRDQSFEIFLPIAIISVITHFIGGWISDRVPLKYLLMLQVLNLGIGSMALMEFQNIWYQYLVIACFGIQSGLWAVLSMVTWPRFFGRTHLGAIAGLAMGCQVFASAIGPPVFGASQSWTGDYNTAAWIAGILNLLLFIGATKAKVYYKKK
ncbi:MAG: MFS transporter [Deltaproteobacteria bacterium]|jgi:MFS transporter, OFA family, oxalate/formate antiporter|nr:MFS transporter [Deltaproteobacteria bacterium]MBT4527693.1 MFS transporter [Deltaproteobacteria bacterium]